jgi:hypothetical protein
MTSQDLSNGSRKLDRREFLRNAALAAVGINSNVLSVPSPATGERERPAKPAKGDRSSVLQTAIREHHGAPTLFIDGRPDTGLMLWYNEVERGHDEIADFARAGIDLLTSNVGSTASMSTDAIDEKMRIILAANSRALVLPGGVRRGSSSWSYPDTCSGGGWVAR